MHPNIHNVKALFTLFKSWGNKGGNKGTGTKLWGRGVGFDFLTFRENGKDREQEAL